MAEGGDGPPPSAPSNMWGADTVDSAPQEPVVVGRRRRDRGSDAGPSTRAATVVDADSSDDIPVIPTLEDVASDHIRGTVAEAPSMAANRIQTIDELDHGLAKFNLPEAADAGIDLSVLTDALPPFAQIQEDESASWTWEGLFQSVAAEIMVEEERRRRTANEDDSVPREEMPRMLG